jgi:hypothetical protein
MSALFRFPSALEHDPRVDAWFSGAARVDPGADALFAEPADELRALARTWFERLRASGPDIRVLLHEGYPVACAQDAAFAYVNVYRAHVGLGFFQGANLPDPARLLEGAGVRMRHVKLRLHQPVNEAALGGLIAAAYQDMCARLKAEGA